MLLLFGKFHALKFKKKEQNFAEIGYPLYT